jgi:hypothetical protein
MKGFREQRQFAGQPFQTKLRVEDRSQFVMMVTDVWNSGKSVVSFVDNAAFLFMIGLILVWKSRLF